MASPLPPEQQDAYSIIIDQILAVSDLNTISAKDIRQGLQDKVGHGLSHQKKAITKLILARFDKYQGDHADEDTDPVAQPPHPTTNGAHSPSIPHKRKVEEEVVGDHKGDSSDVHDPPPAKKVKKVAQPESDEQMAKRMQAELNQQAARSTRGGGTKRKAVVKTAKKPKKKSAAKVNSGDDSDVDSSAVDKPEKEKKGAFHKLMLLSPPLQALLGESKLSRPQTVKRIWAYVRERDLQQPDDRRNILCDDALRAVFKTDKVHMFTMNKILATQLYPADEV